MNYLARKKIKIILIIHCRLGCYPDHQNDIGSEFTDVGLCWRMTSSYFLRHTCEACTERLMGPSRHMTLHACFSGTSSKKSEIFSYLKIEKTYQHQINYNNTTKHFSKQNDQTIESI